MSAHFYRVVSRAGVKTIKGVEREKAIRLYCEQGDESWLLQVRGPQLTGGGFVEGKAFMTANAWLNRDDLLALRSAIDELLNSGKEPRS